MRTAIANDASPCVEVKQTGPVTVIVMKQPERLNALSPQLLIDPDLDLTQVERSIWRDEISTVLTE